MRRWGVETMGKGGPRQAGPGKFMGRPVLKEDVKKIKTSITLRPDHLERMTGEKKSVVIEKALDHFFDKVEGDDLDIIMDETMDETMDGILDGKGLSLSDALRLSGEDNSPVAFNDEDQTGTVYPCGCVYFTKGPTYDLFCDYHRTTGIFINKIIPI
jgi:hypothetical protein